MKRINFDKQANKELFKRITFNEVENQEADNSARTLKGYVAKWNVLSTDRGGYFVALPPNSMVLPNYPVTLQFNHNSDYILATEANGTLSIETNDIGVSINANLDDTYIDNYVLTKVKRKTIKGMSFGTYVLSSHTETRVITPEDAVGNSELAQFVGKEATIEVYDQWLLDEATITGVPSFPQTSIEAFEKGIEENQHVDNDIYEIEAEITGLSIE